MQKCPWELSTVFRVLRSTVGGQSGPLQIQARSGSPTIDRVDLVRNDLLESSQSASPIPASVMSTKAGNMTDNNNNNSELRRGNINIVVSQAGSVLVLGNDRASLIQCPIANVLGIYKLSILNMQIYPYWKAIINGECSGYRCSPRIIVDFRFLGIGIESMLPPLSFPYTLYLSSSMLVERPLLYERASSAEKSLVSISIWPNIQRRRKLRWSHRSIAIRSLRKHSVDIIAFGVAASRNQYFPKPYFLLQMCRTRTELYTRCVWLTDIKKPSTLCLVFNRGIGWTKIFLGQLQLVSVVTFSLSYLKI